MSTGYKNNRAYTSAAPGAWTKIAATDFGVPAPAAASIVLTSGTGSLSTGTAGVKVVWITAEGLSLASPATTSATATANNELTVTQPALPATVNGQQNVIGWQIYSANSTAAPGAGAYLLNIVSTSVTPAPVNIITSEGTELGFLVATTSVVVTVKGTGAGTPGLDNSGIQKALPGIAANTAADYYAVIPNTGSQWKQQKSIEYMNPDGIDETLGIVLNKIDFIQPVYPGAAQPPQGGANPPSSTYTQVSVAPGAYCVINGYLFEAVQAASASTAAAFIGFAAFNLAKGSQTTDGSVTWQSFGKAGLARFHFSNVSTTTSTPANRGYDMFQN